MLFSVDCRKWIFNPEKGFVIDLLFRNSSTVLVAPVPWSYPSA
jgi:hypothetical protein